VRDTHFQGLGSWDLQSTERRRASEGNRVAGDLATATVTKSVPFGVLVESAGLPGLVRGVQGELGTELRVRVLEFDPAQQRFSAEPA
jgi:hypothetical protein